jgi:succinate dehydrogenase/fumarate reductase flavoprotein subunit
MSFHHSEECLETDVLVLGGGLAGCMSAIKAADRGADVVVFEKAHINRSGNGCTGLHRIPLIHPDYNYTFEEFARLNVANAAGLCDEDVSREFARDTLDRVLDLESYGLPVRKRDGSFLFKPARDISPGEIVIWPPAERVWQDVKPVLAKQVHKRERVRVINRIAAIGLLTEAGAAGTRVVGAIGMETRTGRFVVCSAKAVVATSGGSYRVGRHKHTLYAPSRFVECGSPTNAGEGQHMAYRAGADLVNLEFLELSPAWKDFSHWGCGPIMVGRDLKGDGQPIVPREGEPIKMARYTQTYTFGKDTEALFQDASVIPGFPERKGEMEEFYIAEENESTSYGYLLYQRERGEDYTKAPIEYEWHPPYLHNNQSGVHMDANAGTSLEGLYVAGDIMGGGYRQSGGGAFVFGARAGVNAAAYARTARKPSVVREQVDREKARILCAADVHPEDGYSWVELEDKARQILSEYGPPFTSDPKLERGVSRLERIRERYLPRLYARNPRELLRASEVRAVFFVVEACLRGGLERKESRSPTVSILYKRQFPEQDDLNWLKHSVVRNREGRMKFGTKEVNRLS